jgi:hypothetical protein
MATSRSDGLWIHRSESPRPGEDPNDRPSICQHGASAGWRPGTSSCLWASNRCRLLAFFGPWRTTCDWRLRGVNHVLIRWSDLHRTDWPFHLNHGQGETPAHSSWTSRYTGSGRTQHKPGPLYLRHQHSIQRIQINGPNDQGGSLVPASSEQL